MKKNNYRILVAAAMLTILGGGEQRKLLECIPLRGLKLMPIAK